MTPIFHLVLGFLLPRLYRSTDHREAVVLTLLCHDHIWHYFLMMGSFQFFSKNSFTACVLNDGSLTKDDAKRLRYFFPDLKIVSLKKITPKITRFLQPYQNLHAFWSDPYLYSHTRNKYKLIGTLYFLSQLTFKKIIWIDSDILFFKKPIEILEWLKQGFGKQKKVGELYMQYAEPETGNGWKEILQLAQSKKIPELLSVNSGILCLKPSVSALERANIFLGEVLKKGYTHDWFVEQLVFADRCNLVGGKFLPKTYFPLSDSSSNASTQPATAIHYHGEKNKKRMLWDGLLLFFQLRFFNQKRT